MIKKTLLGLFALVAASLVATAYGAADFQVVVNSDRADTSLSESQLSRIFLKKTTRWDDGSKIQPLDQEKGSSIRAAFLSEVHDKDENEYAKYWVKLVFSGRAKQPDVLSGDAAVLSAVAADSSAIGYVSKGVPLPSGVKVLKVGE